MQRDEGGDRGDGAPGPDGAGGDSKVAGHGGSVHLMTEEECVGVVESIMNPATEMVFLVTAQDGNVRGRLWAADGLDIGRALKATLRLIGAEMSGPPAGTVH